MSEFPTNQDLSLQDMRVIIHGLKMAGFASVEPEALDQIRFRIKGLPSPEELNKLADDAGSLKRLAAEVGEIMRNLEIYGKKDPEFKARYESLKGLPPRYKVLDWKPNMEKSMKNTVLARKVVFASMKADSKGHGEVARQLNTFARNVLDEKVTESEVKSVVASLAKIDFKDDAKLIQEAAWWSPKGVGKQIGNAIKTKWQNTYKDKLVGEINAAISKFEQSMDTNVLFQECDKLEKGWKVNLTDKIKATDDGKITQALLDQINTLKTEAQAFNEKMINEFNTWIAQQKQQITNIAGGQAAASVTPANQQATASEVTSPVVSPPASIDPKNPASWTDTSLAQKVYDYIIKWIPNLKNANRKSLLKLAQAGIPPEIIDHINSLAAIPGGLANYAKQLKSHIASIAQPTNNSPIQPMATQQDNSSKEQNQKAEGAFINPQNLPVGGQLGQQKQQKPKESILNKIKNVFSPKPQFPNGGEIQLNQRGVPLKVQNTKYKITRIA